jgi:DNA-binding CsgD family transcriptional regulator
MVAVDLLRSRRSIARRDAGARASVHARPAARTRAIVDAYRAALDACDAALVFAGRDGAVAHASGRAEDLLAAYGGEDLGLDPRISAWLAAGAAQPLLIAGPRGRLRVRELSGDAWAPWRALLLEEERVRAPSLAALCDLGLTPREAQVLRLVCAGKGNDRIALELEISSRTVGKHLERAYAKLGVGSRAAAIARMLGLATR